MAEVWEKVKARHREDGGKTVDLEQITVVVRGVKELWALKGAIEEHVNPLTQNQGGEEEGERWGDDDQELGEA
eukprot:273455-Rhodomonas_salina.1